MGTPEEKPFFLQLGITHIVWVDDLFDQPEELSEIELSEKIGVAAASHTLKPHPEIADLKVEDPPQEWAHVLKERLDVSAIKRFLGEIQPADPDSGDYSGAEVAEVVSVLGPHISCVGFEQWAREKEALTQGSARGVYIVDRERLIDGQPVKVGDEIVRELVADQPDAIVLVLTHSASSTNVNELRDELAQSLNVPKSKIGLVSKRSEEGLAKGIRVAFRLVFTQVTCASVTEKIIEAMKESLEKTRTSLMMVPIQHLDRAVFQNSFDEGASEIDVLIRILSSRQRAEVESQVAGAIDDLHSPLARLRKLRGMEELPALSGEESNLLATWSREEVFESADRVNGLRSPIACGDVFRKGETKQYYILLGPPCDLTVRPDGSRSADEAFLVKLKPEFTPASGSEWRYFEIPSLEGTGRWAIDFRGWVSVQLACIEWASFNSDGSLAFAPGNGPPPGLLPGWERRFLDAKNRLRDRRVYCLSLGSLSGKVAVAAKGRVSFGYRRIARLHGPRAAAAFSAFGNFQARGAFDHDFAKGLESDAGAGSHPEETRREAMPTD